jgi:ferrous iron transport protein A
LVKSVAQLKHGEKGIISGFENPDFPLKLMEMGCLPGNEVELLQVAPLQDPLYLKVNGTFMAIRTDMAAQILLEANEDASL